MIRGLLRLVLVVVVLVAAGAFLLGYRWTDVRDSVDLEGPSGTSGVNPINTDRVREVGAEVGEKVAEGADRAQRAVGEAGLTAKIKSKMALDDSVKALNIDVDTVGSVVTLTGRVTTEAERTRAVQLARETDGVTSVVDRLSIVGP
jgi:osmotically-inducible protein OsmY